MYHFPWRRLLPDVMIITGHSIFVSLFTSHGVSWFCFSKTLSNFVHGPLVFHFRVKTSRFVSLQESPSSGMNVAKNVLSDCSFVPDFLRMISMAIVKNELPKDRISNVTNGFPSSPE